MDPEIEQGLYGDLSYSEETRLRQQDYLEEMMASGVAPEDLAISYPTYVINRQPTFKTTRETNPALNEMIMAREAMVKPELRENEAYEQAYQNFIKRGYGEAASGNLSTGIVYWTDKLLSGGEGNLMRGGYMDADTAKAYDWAQETFKTYNSYEAGLVNTSQTAVKIGGFVADAVILNKILGNDMSTVQKALTTKNSAAANNFIGRAVTEKFIQNATKSGKDISKFYTTAGKISTQFVEDIAMGTAFMARDILLSPELKDMERSEAVKQLAAEFGTGVAVDFFLNGLMNVAIPGAKSYGKIFMSPFKSNVADIKTMDDAFDIMSDALNLNVTPETLDSLRKSGATEFADQVVEFQSRVKEIRTLKSLGQDELATSKMLANSVNMDINEIDGGFEVIKDTIAKKPKKITVNTLEDALNLVESKNLNRLKKSASETYELASVTKDLKITQRFEGQIKSPEAKVELAEFTESVLPRSGSFNRTNKGDALQYTKNTIRNLSEGTVENLDNLSVKIVDDFFDMAPSVKSDQLSLPRQIMNGAQHKAYADYISKFITEHGNNIDGEALQGVLNTLAEYTGAWSVRDADWIASQAAKNGIEIHNIDGQHIIRDNGEEIAFKSEDLMNNYIFMKTYTDEDYTNYLKAEKGYGIDIDPETNKWAVYNQFGSKVAVGDSIEQITAQNPGLRPKYPLYTGPKLSFVNDNVRAVRFNGQTIEGSVEQINNYFKNYSDTKMTADIADMKKSKYFKNSEGKRVRVDVNKRSWLVESPTTGMKPRVFKSEKSLQNFLNQIGTPEKTLLHTAREKGVQITANKAGYLIEKAGEPTIVAKNYEEAVKKIKELPNQPLAPEALEKTARYSEQQAEIYGKEFSNVSPVNFSEDQNIAALRKTMDNMEEKFYSKDRSSLSKSLSNVFSRFRDGRAKIAAIPKGKPELLPIIDKFNNVMESEKIMKTVQAEFGRGLSGLNKLVKKDRRKDLGRLLSKELPETEWNDAWRALTGETSLKGEDIQYLQGIRKVFDDAAQVNGFTATMEHIENYFPRIKTISIEDILNPDNDSIKLMKKALGRELSPAETKFYSKMRSVDLLEFKIQDDPSLLLSKYVDDTLRANVLEPVVQDMADFAQRNIDDAQDLERVMELARAARGYNDDALTETIKVLYDDIALKFHRNAHSAQTNVFKKGESSFKPKEFFKNALEDVNEETLSKLPAEDLARFEEAISKRRFRQNPTNQAMGLITLGTQAFKPWLPIRNTFQPETHLAPIFGLDAVMQAKKDVSKLTPEGWKYLRDNSIFQAKTIQEHMGITGSGVVSKANEVGLASYKASDDFDRAVGFFTIKNSLDEAMDAVKNWGDKGTNYFLESTRLYTAPKSVRDEVLTNLSAGRTDLATLSYAKWMNSMTFLDYSNIAKPQAYNSFFGKMFGQMGTFSTQTFSSRKYFTERMTAKDTALYVSRAVLGGFALNSAFSEMTGTEVNNFSTFKSMMFGGGPMVQTMYNVSRLVGPEYQRTEARSELTNQFLTAATPFQTAVNIGQGIGKIAEGDTRAGILQAINAPGKGKFKPYEKDFWDYANRL